MGGIPRNKCKSGNEPLAEQADIDFHMSIFSVQPATKCLHLPANASLISYSRRYIPAETRLSADESITKQWIKDHTQIFEDYKKP